jgi:hypothetical protein
MGKSISNMVRNYIQKLSNADLLWVYTRLHDRLGGDVAEAVQFMSKTNEMDRWLSTSQSATELYDMIDLVYDQISKDDRMPTLTTS